MNYNKETTLQNLIKSKATWTNGQGPLSDVVVSSRIRLARNIDNISFTSRAGQKELESIFKIIQKIVNENSIFNDFNILLLDKLSPLESQFLMEKNLISSYFAKEKYPFRSCMFNKEETLSIMVNEEDHIRIQSLDSGLQLKKIWKLISRVDDEIEKKVTYAFNEQEGYLTSCPTNVGTGMRASVMLHLPALVMENRMKEILKAIYKIGYVVRGFYGEGSKAMGNLFQISNQITLGLSEEEIIESLIRLCKKIIVQEKNERKKLLSDGKDKFEDRAWRAYGLLHNVRIISSMEAMELLSKLRLGVELEMIPNIKLNQLNQLMLMIQPAYLQIMYKETADQINRDIKRATLIRSKISIE